MAQQTEVPQLLYSKRDAAAALGVSLRTVENFLATGELAARRIGRRTLVLASSLESFTRRDHGSPSPPRRANRLNAEDVQAPEAPGVGTET